MQVLKKRKSLLGLLWIIEVIILVLPLYLQAEEVQPIARFHFIKSTYQLNEPIEVIDESYSPSGNRLTKREWKAKINGKWKTSSSIKTLLVNVKEGEIEVFLRVKDSKNNWSNWVGQKAKITQPKAIQITKFSSEKEVYGIGEKFQINISYDNPNELSIKSQRWRYRNISMNGSTISGKPKYFKKAGTYEVSLEVQDEWGNWSNKVSCQVVVSNEKIERDGYYLFEKGKQGDLIDGYVDKDYNSFEEINTITVTDVPGTLIMSNSPESVPSSGILYKATASGIGRLLVHHKNATSYEKKLLVLVAASEDEAVTLEVSNEAIEGPSKNILATGQKAVIDYLKGSKVQTYQLKAGQTVCLYDSSKIKSWKPDEVISGTLDFKATGKVTFQVVAMDKQSNLEHLNQLNILPRDVHNRGTFNVIERQYVLDLQNINQPTKLVLGREQGEWLKGIDDLTEETMWNKGNYGVPIKITIQNNEDIGVILNARGGSYLGAVKWNKNTVFAVPNEEVLNDQKVAALIGRVKAGEANEVTYMLPNGSSAPILFGFIPKSVWK